MCSFGNSLPVYLKGNTHCLLIAVQVKHMFKWVKDRAGFEASFRVIFYPAEYNKRMLGIFPIGDPISYVPEAEVKISVASASVADSADLPRLLMCVCRCMSNRGT